MKQNLFNSYISGIFDSTEGESYSGILRYFFPEFISALLLYSLPLILDAYFVSKLSSTTYATLGATNNFLHFVVKLAEAFSVGTIILTGQFNGRHQYKKAGDTLRDSFWVTCITGFVLALFLYFGGYWIYYWYDVPAELIPQGIPFVQLRAISIFLMFMYMACVGFLRGIKNVKIPMITFIIGAIAFILFDYMLIFGAFGIPAFGLRGSAIASIIQYGLMFCGVMAYVLLDKNVRKYGIHLFTEFKSFAYIGRLISLSWPVVLDKSIMAAAYIWLCKMICPMGTNAIASFSLIKDMERFAFLPAIAFAQVITLLVSNDFGAKNWKAIKSNIKKVGFLASLMVFAVLLLFSWHSKWIMHYFDNNNEFTPLAAKAFPFISVLVFFDLIQLVLSGALRGSGNVRTVMYVRFIVCFCYFIPFSYMLSRILVGNGWVKFVLIYGSFYIGNALMSIAYIRKLRGDSWKAPVVQG